MAETSDTCSESTTNICIDERQLCCLVEVLIVHVVDEVQCLHINASQPVHHIHETWHELLVSQYITLNGAILRTALIACLCVNTARNSVGQALSQVGTCTEELHLLTRLCSRYTAADAIVVTPNWAHYVIVLILDRACLYRNQRSVVLECLWQARAIEYSEVWLW